MKKSQIVFKVVTRDNCKLYSYVRRFSSLHTLRYMIGHVTKPKFGKIFAFDTFENAADYVRISGFAALTILKCRGKNVTEFAHRSIPWGDETFYFTDFWNDTSSQEWNLRTKTGTVLCDELEVLEKVR